MTHKPLGSFLRLENIGVIPVQLDASELGIIVPAFTDDHRQPGDCAGIIGSTPSISPCRRHMTRAELFGRHTYQSTNGVKVHIWRRDNQLLARGRCRGRQFGQKLGGDPVQADSALRKILVAIENGAFLPPSEARRLPLKQAAASHLTMRDLANRFLAETRRLRGRKTAQNYVGRLAPMLVFAELPSNCRRWPEAASVDRKFSIAFRVYLHGLLLSRNGHPAAEQHHISGRQIHNVLSCAATMLHWGKRPDVNLLPGGFVNPITHDIIGARPQKDLLAPPKLPLELRIDMVRTMDAWELGILSLPCVLPQRPEEFAGLLISDIDRSRRELAFGTRLSGADFNKARMTFRVPYPPQLDAIIAWWCRSRGDGPLLLARSIVEGRRRPRHTMIDGVTVASAFDTAMANQSPGRIQAEQDRKAVFRRLLLDMGGVSTDEMARVFKCRLMDIRPGLTVRFYDARGSVTSDMRAAGVDYVLRRYLTGHSLQREIMATYESADLHTEMQRYFDHITPLLNAIASRAIEVGIAALGRDEER